MKTKNSNLSLQHSILRGANLNFRDKCEDHFYLSAEIRIDSFSLITPFKGTHEPNKSNSCQLNGFIDQLIAMDRHRIGDGFESP